MPGPRARAFHLPGRARPGVPAIGQVERLGSPPSAAGPPQTYRSRGCGGPPRPPLPASPPPGAGRAVPSEMRFARPGSGSRSWRRAEGGARAAASCPRPSPRPRRPEPHFLRRAAPGSCARSGPPRWDATPRALRAAEPCARPAAPRRAPGPRQAGSPRLEAPGRLGGHHHGQRGRQLRAARAARRAAPQAARGAQAAHARGRRAGGAVPPGAGEWGHPVPSRAHVRARVPRRCMEAPGEPLASPRGAALSPPKVSSAAPSFPPQGAPGSQGSPELSCEEVGIGLAKGVPPTPPHPAAGV